MTDRTFEQTYDDAGARLDQMRLVDALWHRRLDIWPADAHASVANRLGWLTALEFIEPQLPRLHAFAESVRTAGFTDVVLLGMGGSSLAPEVLHRVLGVAPGFPRFRMLDSVDPDAVRSALDAATTSLFIVASKSGSTIEPNTMLAEARRRVLTVGLDWGSRAVAITDDDSSLHRRATSEHWRDVFINPSDIGGRYSALSFFGMVPAALLGANIERILSGARAMAEACRRQSIDENPGLALGAFMAAGEQTGRDKLTLVLPEALQSLGLWIEQLVAESTGKSGRGIVPIAGEPPAFCRGKDRVAVVVRLGQDLTAAVPVDTPSFECAVPDASGIGAEFFRWEFATATAGALMGVNPFDEPNVAEAKHATTELLTAYATERRLPIGEPHAAVAHARLTLSAAAIDALGGEPATTFLRLLREGDYLGVLAYVPPDNQALAEALGAFRIAVGGSTGYATTIGLGPRYLHSTGQLHKGGADNGVFLVLTAGGYEDLGIPGMPYSFGTLELAQALGDFRSLERKYRRALHIHFPARDQRIFQQVLMVLLKESGLDTVGNIPLDT